ncbi:SMP-30/gluconolactonase/LRE family protein [Streptomyces capparidis]
MSAEHGEKGLEVLVGPGARLGEGPTWDTAAGRLLWVDILACQVHAVDPASGADTVLLTTRSHVGAAKPRAGGGLVVNLRDGVGLHDPDGAFRWLLHDPVEGRRGNDAAVDAQGGLWAGSMRYDEAPGGGELRRVGPDGQWATVLDDVTVSNGIGWSPDGRLMYYVDTPTGRIDVLDVADGGAAVTGRRPFAEIPPPGQPDGLTVDADGCVWVALWEGGAVHRYTPDGRLDRVVRLPVTRTTACAFGGSGLTDLYITSATVGLDERALAEQPLAGAVFVLPGAGTGLPGHAFAG